MTQTQGVLSQALKTAKRPTVFPKAKFNVDDMNALSNQHIIGHEFGHALQRQLRLANLGLEEDAADGFASFYNGIEDRPDIALAGAILFDELALQEGKLTLEGLSSDHPVTQQRVFNFLCYVEGSDPKKYDKSLVDSGFLPKTRAPLCPQASAMLNYGWWTQLKPHFKKSFEDEGNKEQKKSEEELIGQGKAFAKKSTKSGRGTRSEGVAHRLNGPRDPIQARTSSSPAPTQAAQLHHRASNSKSSG